MSRGWRWLLPALVGLAAPAAAQVSLGPPQRVDMGGAAPANETSVAASPALPMRLLVAWNDYRVGNARTGVALSTNGGTSWSDQLLRPPVVHQTTDEGDPMTAFDPRTGRLWAGGIAFGSPGGVFVASLDPGATSFHPSVMARVTPAADKGWMAAGPDPSDPSLTRLYVAYNQGLLISDDGGASWSNPGALGAGTAFLPRVGPGGELYVAFWSGGTPHFVWRSFDGGQTLQGPSLIASRMDFWTDGSDRVPGDFRVPPLQTFAVDPTTGDLHCIFCDTTSVSGGETNLDLYWTTSSDHGVSWSAPTVFHGDSSPAGDQFFPWLEIDAEGRLHAVWFDTRENLQLDADPFALIDAYYAYSEDQGQSWTELRLTDQSFSSADAGFGGAFIGDYLGLATAGGRTTVAYPDTSSGDADILVRSIVHGVATEFCWGAACPCGNDDLESGCGNDGDDGQTDTGARLSVAGGSADVVLDDLELELEGLGPNQFGLLFTSQQPTRVAFGAGFRCLDNPFFRYPIQQADGSGDLTLGPGQVLGIAQANFGPMGQVMAGATWHYQAWYRDPNGPCSTFNFSNGLSITWN